MMEKVNLDGAVVNRIRFKLNGREKNLDVASHENLVDLLVRLDHFSARESCGQGLCGCCTVLVDEIPVSACLTLAQLVDGSEVKTAEGLAPPGELDFVQRAFIEEGAFQCGFCTPGFVMMTHALLKETVDPSETEIREYLAGNLCRCAAYPEIIRAVKTAARNRPERTEKP
ncbi:carbon-monoxide dehydrogenase small subunit [Roseovarius pacificus]|uniref:Carbon-monoxide dehydrogenase small subunit n=1 Tax=Roseovarius pacificus TaxID=337701 RepID=A0A1M7A399_9RHOB|nr:(2Fe-2S)-binding protein [Roseovarius pacificus]GGO53935.1 (2Fe-2S)-binding protein [Roseovarius pacificus]SHL37221.1 carbon-monoxide dehydrogenase small subunit [Roseovarius pacificus]